jgi:hypothetical protein
MRRRDQAVLGREWRDEGLALVETAGPMQEENRRSLSGFEQFELDVCDFDGLQAGTSRNDAV